ncbi:MAG: transcription termination/antitermination protein NusA [Dehalococcoidia bacterium]|nr:MAG: transcription termination/antitermination protein NusA [Dehalococcoidia bacterium]
MKTELKTAITQLSAERNLPKEVVLAALESALASAYKRNISALEQDVLVKVDPDIGEINFYIQKVVVDSVTNPNHEISLEEARKLRVTAQLGDVINIECTPKNIGRIAVQAAKQVVLQRLREAEHRIVYEEFTDREGNVVTGIIQFIEPRRIYVRLNKIEAVLPLNEQVSNEHYYRGQRHKFYILEMIQRDKEPQIIVSRSHPNLIRGLFELEIPEVHNGVVELKAIARDVGHRTKVAVATTQENVDPVGCCLGPRGIRLQSIINELNGEKIDVIQWHADPAVFISNALSPAQVAGTKIDEERNISTVVVPDKQLSLAIGKEGQNARLAAKLTGWRIDIKSVSAIESERAVIEEPKTAAEVIPAEVKEREPLEAEPAEEIGMEEMVEFPSIPEAPPEKPEEKHIRFAEDILMGALKAKKPDKTPSEPKGKRKGKVLKYKKQDEHFIDDGREE